MPAKAGAAAPKTPATRSAVRKPKADAYLGAPESVDQAREALAAFTRPGDVGDYTGLTMRAERLGELRFECTMPGYRGWSWVVTVARVPRSRTATVSETELVPGDDSLLAPAWVPWAERLRPGDLGPGDVLPHVADDSRLEQGYEATGEEDEDRLAVYELGLGRPRVLSPLGRGEAADRWYAGPGGPTAKEAVKAGAHCATCGFVTPLAGSLRGLFGVCTNEWSSRDGQVVSYDHGCGAHSETDTVDTGVQWPEPDPYLDDSSIIEMDLDQDSGDPDASAEVTQSETEEAAPGEAAASDTPAADVED
ncbi:MAG: DUF3027 domain-containing protein [Bifidobacteriaceae bacterium]|jgi:hypothetical protein|nr:DUF3027 domain-containing protein [Bifidobacteriaceae bacterium]